MLDATNSQNYTKDATKEFLYVEDPFPLPWFRGSRAFAPSKHNINYM